LNQIDFLRDRYPGHTIGWSSHECTDWSSSIAIAYAKGARTFERTSMSKWTASRWPNIPRCPIKSTLVQFALPSVWDRRRRVIDGRSMSRFSKKVTMSSIVLAASRKETMTGLRVREIFSIRSQSLLVGAGDLMWAGRTPTHNRPIAHQRESPGDAPLRRTNSTQLLVTFPSRVSFR